MSKNIWAAETLIDGLKKKHTKLVGQGRRDETGRDRRGDM